MNKSIDLHVRFGSNEVLNIRVFILLETPDGFIFEKSNDGYYFPIGGRIQLFETAQDALSRELFEELQLKDVQVDFISLIENFFTYADGAKCHEICFVYRGFLQESIDVSDMKPPDNDHKGYEIIKVEDFDRYSIKPNVIKDIITSTKAFTHIVIK